MDHEMVVQSLEDGFSWADALRAEGIKLDVWTVDVTNPRARSHASRLRGMGVALWTSNTPEALQHLLETGGEALTTHFYRLMLAESAEVQPLFNSVHQQTGAQPRALARSVMRCLWCHRSGCSPFHRLKAARMVPCLVLSTLCGGC